MFKEQELVINQIYEVFSIFIQSNCKIRPHFFLTGPSGSGKSYLINQIAKENNIAFLEINAAQLTAEGLSGNSLSKAMRPLRLNWNIPNIIFIDEFDKLFQRNGEESQNFRSDVQDEFLRVLEGEYCSIFTDYGKYEQIKVNNSLFIFAGAFSNQQVTTFKHLKDMGIRNEFIGRVPLIYYTTPISLDSMINHIPNMDLFINYMKICPVQKIKAIKEISAILTQEYEYSNIGIRLIESVIHRYFINLKLKRK